MNYKLYKRVSPNLSATQQFLYNRGIPLEEQEAWIHAGWESINDWFLFHQTKEESADKMICAANLVKNIIQNNYKVQIVVDPDVDGYTSAAILTNYLYKLYPEWTHSNLTHIMHTGKEHGLSDVMDLICSDTKLVICPDSASNDREQHKILYDKGIHVLCLDHHECDCDSEYALIINAQICDYPNKALTGAGVTWQFCRAYDDLYASEPCAKDFLDLAALGNCGDMASYKKREIRALCNLGFKNIHNPFFFSMAKKNNYSIQKKNGINYYSVAFYVVPFINATIRSGTMEEKKMIFDAMLSEYAFEKVESSKRGEKGILVPRYQEAVTIAERVKRRQTKLQDEAMALLEKQIEDKQLLNNSILVFLCNPGEVEKNILGLAANKLQAKYQKPCLVLIKSKTINDKEYYYRGSGRNYSLSKKDNLKQELEKTGLVEYVAGHINAFGTSIAEKDIDNFIERFNSQYENVDQTPTYWVDYVWGSMDIDSNKILEIASFDIYGQNIPESLVCIANIPVSEKNVTLMSADKNPTLKIQIGNVSVIKFKSSQEEYEKFIQPNTIFTAVCKCEINSWKDKVSPQLLVEEFELRKEWIF